MISNDDGRDLLHDAFAFALAICKSTHVGPGRALVRESLADLTGVW